MHSSYQWRNYTHLSIIEPPTRIALRQWPSSWFLSAFSLNLRRCHPKNPPFLLCVFCCSQQRLWSWGGDRAVTLSWECNLEPNVFPIFTWINHTVTNHLLLEKRRGNPSPSLWLCRVHHLKFSTLQLWHVEVRARLWSVWSPQSLAAVSCRHSVDIKRHFKGHIYRNYGSWQLPTCP